MKRILVIMAALFCAEVGAQVSAPTFDIVKTADGSELKINFFGHGSIGFEYEGKHVYIDPVSDFADYRRLPKADLILVGHQHGDHLDPKAIEALYKNETVGFGSGAAVLSFDYGTPEMIMTPGDVKKLPYVTLEAVPAYNTSPDRLNFHPKSELHIGWVLTFGGTRVYVAGDSEDTPEMLALKDIDIAFLPVNQPYTMTEEQAARAVKAIKPTIFYPYHYGQVEHKTDLEKLATLIADNGVEIRIRPLE
jgi:L-ascorbate metabolism protein UlaG (beta-lactamase superfamily)